MPASMWLSADAASGVLPGAPFAHTCSSYAMQAPSGSVLALPQPDFVVVDVDGLAIHPGVHGRPDDGDDSPGRAGLVGVGGTGHRWPGCRAARTGGLAALRGRLRAAPTSADRGPTRDSGELLLQRHRPLQEPVVQHHGPGHVAALILLQGDLSNP